MLMVYLVTPIILQSGEEQCMHALANRYATSPAAVDLTFLCSTYLRNAVNSTADRLPSDLPVYVLVCRATCMQTLRSHDVLLAQSVLLSAAINKYVAQILWSP